MAADAIVVSLDTYKPGRARRTFRVVHVLYVGDDRRPADLGAGLSLKDRNIRIEIHRAASAEDIEAHLGARRHDLYIVEQWIDRTNIVPLIDLCLQDQAARTVVLSDHPEAERDLIRDRFPGALTLSRYDLDAERLINLVNAPSALEGADHRDLSATEGLLAATATLRAAVSGIRREMSVADADLDRGDALSGQAHLVAALRRLTDVEDALGRMELTLSAQRLPTEEKA